MSMPTDEDNSEMKAIKSQNRYTNSRFVPLLAAVLILVIGILFAYLVAADTISYEVIDVLSGFVLSSALVAIYVFIASETQEQSHLIGQQSKISRQLKEIQKAEYLPAIRVSELDFSDDFVEFACVNVLRGPAVNLRLRTQIVFPESDHPNLMEIPIYDDNGVELGKFDIEPIDVPLNRANTKTQQAIGDVLEGQDSDIFRARSKFAFKNLEELNPNSFHSQYYELFEQKEGYRRSFSDFLRHLENSEIERLGIKLEIVYDTISPVDNTTISQEVAVLGGNPKEANTLQQFVEMDWKIHLHETPEGRKNHWIIQRDQSSRQK